jgi:hypothetical protein
MVVMGAELIFNVVVMGNCDFVLLQLLLLGLLGRNPCLLYMVFLKYAKLSCGGEKYLEFPTAVQIVHTLVVHKSYQ